MSTDDQNRSMGLERTAIQGVPKAYPKLTNLDIWKSLAFISFASHSSGKSNGMPEVILPRIQPVSLLCSKHTNHLLNVKELCSHQVLTNRPLSETLIADLLEDLV